MNNINNSIVSGVLGDLLEGRILNRKDFNNWSLHSWISALRNERFIPIESTKTYDGTCDYFMYPSEIARYKDPIQRMDQREEMKAYVENRRRQKAMKKL